MKAKIQSAEVLSKDGFQQWSQEKKKGQTLGVGQDINISQWVARNNINNYKFQICGSSRRVNVRRQTKQNKLQYIKPTVKQDGGYI